MIRARKRFGQHFLEPAWAEKVVRAIDPQPHDTFLEIGPGAGALTALLARRVRRIVAVEIDRDLVRRLGSASLSNVTILQGDFLALSAGDLEASLEREPVRVAGNLPYNIASPILFRLVELRDRGLPISEATLMLQREVADRLVAKPGTRDYGVLTILIGHVASVERVLALPPGAFRPAPRVHSALVRLSFHPRSPAVQGPAAFTAMVRAIFSRRRKTLANALLAFDRAASTDLHKLLARNGLDASRRPETFTIAELARLSDLLADSDAPSPPRADRAVL